MHIRLVWQYYILNHILNFIHFMGLGLGLGYGLGLGLGLVLALAQP